VLDLLQGAVEVAPLVICAGQDRWHLSLAWGPPADDTVAGTNVRRLAASASGLGDRVLGIWMIGTGLNDAPLAAYAMALSRSGALNAELAGVEARPGRCRYSAGAQDDSQARIGLR
jgi:hypothetical protein